MDTVYKFRKVTNRYEIYEETTYDSGQTRIGEVVEYAVTRSGAEEKCEKWNNKE